MTTAAPAAPAAVTTPAAPVAPTPGTPEHDAAMVAKFEGASKAAVPTVPSADPTPVAPPDTKILGKFATTEDLAKAYTELEKKLGAPKAPEAAPPATPPATPESKLTVDTSAQTPEQKAAAEATAKAGVDYVALNAEYADKGALSPETYAKLEQGGIPKEMVDGYIAGQQALAAQAAAAYDQAAFSQAGGEAKFTEMTTWAKTGLTRPEAEAFNAAVTSGDKTQMQLAVANLRTKYEANLGSLPTSPLTAGVAAQGLQGYTSMAQVTADMKKPEYAKDPAFRASVAARIEASTSLYSVIERN